MEPVRNADYLLAEFLWRKRNFESRCVVVLRNTVRASVLHDDKRK